MPVSPKDCAAQQRGDIFEKNSIRSLFIGAMGEAGCWAKANSPPTAVPPSVGTAGWPGPSAEAAPRRRRTKPSWTGQSIPLFTWRKESTSWSSAMTNWGEPLLFNQPVSSQARQPRGCGPRRDFCGYRAGVGRCGWLPSCGLGPVDSRPVEGRHRFASFAQNPWQYS